MTTCVSSASLQSPFLPGFCPGSFLYQLSAPSAEHPADLGDILRKMSVLFRVHRLGVPCERKQKLEQVDACDTAVEQSDFLRLPAITRKKAKLDGVEENVVYARVENLIPQIAQFLDKRLALSLHPDKVYIKAFASGVDFLGWVHFSDHRTLRTSTKRRMLKRVQAADNRESTMQSYLGLLSHGNAKRLSAKIRKGREVRYEINHS